MNFNQMKRFNELTDINNFILSFNQKHNTKATFNILRFANSSKAKITNPHGDYHIILSLALNPHDTIKKTSIAFNIYVDELPDIDSLEINIRSNRFYSQNNRLFTEDEFSLIYSSIANWIEHFLLPKNDRKCILFNFHLDHDILTKEFYSTQKNLHGLGYITKDLIYLPSGMAKLNECGVENILFQNNAPSNTFLNMNNLLLSTLLALRTNLQESLFVYDGNVHTTSPVDLNFLLYSLYKGTSKWTIASTHLEFSLDLFNNKLIITKTNPNEKFSFKLDDSLPISLHTCLQSIVEDNHLNFLIYDNYLLLTSELIKRTLTDNFNLFNRHQNYLKDYIFKSIQRIILKENLLNTHPELILKSCLYRSNPVFEVSLTKNKYTSFFETADYGSWRFTISFSKNIPTVLIEHL